MDIYLAKQPIFDMHNNTYAYELLFRNNTAINEYNGFCGDNSTVDVIINSFFDLHTRDILNGKKAFINFTENLILRGTPKLLPPETVVVEILETVFPKREIVDSVIELKNLGYTIALDDFVFGDEYQELFDLCDIIKIDFKCLQADIERTVKACQKQNKIILAEKVETHKDCEYAKKIGAKLIQGYYYAKPTIITKKSVSPMTKSFIDILTLLSGGEPDVERIVDVISADAALVVKLLKLVNSAYFGTANRISTIKQAVVMLGFGPLKEWVYLLGMNRMRGNNFDELLRLSLMRAKFCQKIAINASNSAENANEAYLMGLISLMHVFSNMTQKQLLNELPLSQTIKDGLTGSDEFFSAVYKLCCAYEKAKWKSVDFYSGKLGVESDLISKLYVECAEFVQNFQKISFESQNN